MTRFHTPLALLTALAALALAPGSAGAATTCAHTTPGVLQITANEHPDNALLQVGAGNVIRIFDEGEVTCAGTVPTTSNVDTVLIVDASDDLSTPAGNDGSMLVQISSPATFAPGKTAEPAGNSEIEFLTDPGAGRDRLALGGPDKQTLVAGSDGAAWNHDGDPEIQGMPFDDLVLFAGDQPDYMSGQGGSGTGNPLANAAAVQLQGGGGNDVLLGTDIASGEKIFGSAGNDTLVAYAGDDDVTPGAGDDTLQGGTGTDRVHFDDSDTGVSVDLANVGEQDTGQGRDSFTGFEDILGSPQADRLFGDAGPNVLRGSLGDDVLDGRGGADDLRGDQGTDAASYAGHPAGVNVDLAKTTQATDGDKFNSIDSLIGSPFADTLAGNAGANRIEARDGVGDRVSCGGGADTAVTDRRSLDSVDADCDSVDALPEPPAPPGPPTGPATGPGAPSGADRTLSFSLAGAKQQRVLRQRGVRVKVRCPAESCTAVTAASASFRVAGSGRKKTTLRIRPVSTRVAAGTTRTVLLRFTRRQLAALRRAFSAGRRPVLKVTATARDAAGNRVQRALPVSGRR